MPTTPVWFRVTRREDGSYALSVYADVDILGALTQSGTPVGSPPSLLRIFDNEVDLIKVYGDLGVIQLQVSDLNGEIRLGDYDGGVYYQTINDEGFFLQTQKTVDIGDPDDAGNSTVLQIDDPNALITLKANAGIKQTVPAVAPELDPSQLAFFLDEGADTLKVSVTYADGTVKTGEIPLI